MLSPTMPRHCVAGFCKTKSREKAKQQTKDLARSSKFEWSFYNHCLVTEGVCYREANGPDAIPTAIFPIDLGILRAKST